MSATCAPRSRTFEASPNNKAVFAPLVVTFPSTGVISKSSSAIAASIFSYVSAEICTCKSSFTVSTFFSAKSTFCIFASLASPIPPLIVIFVPVSSSKRF